MENYSDFAVPQYGDTRMSKKLVKVRFTGILAEKFGEHHKCRASSLKEVGSFARVCVDGFKEHILDTANQLTYHCVNIKKSGYQIELGDSDLGNPLGNTKEVVISPVPSGSGGFLKTIGGLALAGIGLWTGQVWLTSLGAGIALSGVSQLLAPSLNTPKGTDREDNFLLNGARNSADPNSAVSLIYGRVFVPLNSLINTEVTTSEFRS